MLSITIPTLTKTITLNGQEVTVHSLPLFFSDNFHRAYPAPKDTDSPGAMMYFTKRLAVRIVEVLGQAEHVGYDVPREQGSEWLTGRPAWDDSAAWPIYATACAEALEMAGFKNHHIEAISKAMDELASRDLDVVQEAGNS